MGKKNNKRNYLLRDGSMQRYGCATEVSMLHVSKNFTALLKSKLKSGCAIENLKVINKELNFSIRTENEIRTIMSK